MKMSTSSFSRYLATGFDEEHEVANRISERIAVLDDGTRLRVTPSNQKNVDELVLVGDIIETNYSTGGKVITVSKHLYYGLPAHTVTFVDIDATPNKDGSYRENLLRWINELVAQDNRILKLFEANNDEVFVVKKPTRLTSFKSHNEAIVVKATKQIRQLKL